MKTECTHCGGHIEFDDDSAGIEAACPHCGNDTLLVAGLHRRAQIGSGQSNSTASVLTWATYAALAIAGMTIIWFVSSVVHKSGFFQGILREMPGAGDMSTFIIGSALLVALVILGGLWITFPLFVYRYLRKIIALLESINRKV